MKYSHDLMGRFMEKVSPEPMSGCWLWNAVPTGDGYGMIMINRVAYLAHRLSWKLFKGDIPDGLFICHKCDTPACVNPHHLFLGSPKDNIGDMIGKRRGHNQKKTHCRMGHPLPLVANYSSGKGRRARLCMTCRSVAHAIANKKYYDKNRGAACV